MSTETANRSNSKQDDGDQLGRLLDKPATIERADLLQMRMENESIMAECRLHPRDLGAVKRELEEQLDTFPDLAHESIYNKPVGEDENGKMKFARGLSIRAAETIAEAYGYCRIRSDVTPIDELTVKVEATFTDYQKGRVWQDGGILSKTYKKSYKKGGGIGVQPDDRFYGVICKAEVSKRIREVVLRSVNSGLKAWYESECERRMGELLTDDVINKTVASFATIGVVVEQLERVIGRPKNMGWTKEDRKKLVGIWNALKDNETTIDQVFGAKGGKEDDAPKPPAGSGSVSGADLTKKPEAVEPPADPNADAMLPWEARIAEAEQDAALDKIATELSDSDLSGSQKDVLILAIAKRRRAISKSK